MFNHFYKLLNIIWVSDICYSTFINLKSICVLPQQAYVDFALPPGIEQIYPNSKSPGNSQFTPLPLSIPSSTKDLERIQVSVYPNPTTDFVTLELPELILTSFHMMDMAGKEMNVEAQIKDGSITFNTSKLNAGMYILEVSGEDFTSLEKFSVKR